MGRSDDESRADAEADRLERLAELVAEPDPDGAERFRPGSFGCHELLDRTSLAMNAVDEWLLAHPACLHNADWFAMAPRAFDALYALYQSVGEIHLGDQGGASDGTGPPGI